jgi:hypothetical protein
MPLSKVSYPYVDPLRITNANIESLFTNAQTFASPFIVQSNSPTATALVARGATSQSADIFQVQNSAGSTLLTIGNGGNTVFSGGVNIFVGDVRVGTASYLSGALSVSSRNASEIGAVVRGFAGQLVDLFQIQNSAGSVLAYHRNDGYYYNTYGMGAGGFLHSGVFVANAQISSLVTNVNYVGMLVRGIAGQVADLQQWQNSTPTTIAKIDNAGNFTVQNDNARIRAVRSTATAQTTGLGADSGQGFVGSESNTPFQIITNNTARLTLSADGTTATFTGAVIAPAATTAIPSLRAPHGTAPSAPTNGDIWTTTTGLFVRINGATVSPILNPMTTQLQSTLAWNATDAQGQIYLNGTTGNRIDWNINGTAAPAFTTRSAGTKLVLYPGVGASSVDYAIGMESSNIWFSTSSSATGFKFYGGTTNIATLSGAGALTLSSSVTTGGALNLNYASPTISSNNVSAATIFGANVSGVTIGTSTIKTTVYPAEPSGTTSGTVTQSAQLSGTKGMPINPRGAAGVALAYTLTASDAGKMIYVSSTPTTPTITIPANTAVAFEIGTTIVVMNDIGAATNVSINITTDTLQLVSTGATGTRTLARYGMCTLVKVTATKWIITGNGVT